MQLLVRCLINIDINKIKTNIQNKPVYKNPVFSKTDLTSKIFLMIK